MPAMATGETPVLADRHRFSGEVGVADMASSYRRYTTPSSDRLGVSTKPSSETDIE